eukprot:TRINITY_DN373_c3_g1_i2.p1 TRINITY_DN373_c3_g1~~TRINITY_DN373_c3_g1_i2.p1  ORF type:complete len:344 (-),score=72.29 TRINITY_DN373_c3_g1_i2:19-1050(-)
MENENATTLLLTGRTVQFASRVQHIVSCIGLEFEDYGLKPYLEDGPNVPTMDFKRGFIRKWIDKVQPDIVNMWDDRINHVKSFRTFLNSFEVESHVTHVNEGEMYIEDPEVEYELINQLISIRQIDDGYIADSVAYTAVFLDEDSVNLVRELYPSHEDWRLYTEHVTICLGALSEEPSSDLYLPRSEYIGQEVTLQGIKIGRSETAFALFIDGITVKSNKPHLTISVSPSGRPGDSLKIIEWENIEPVTIRGVVREKVIKRWVKNRNSSRLRNRGRSKQNQPKIDFANILNEALPELEDRKCYGRIIGEIRKYLNSQKFEEGADHNQICFDFVIANKDKYLPS